MFVRSCIPQTRTRESGRESLSESNCQIWSTRSQPHRASGQVIVVDSGVWIDFLNGRNAPHVRRLRAILGIDEVIVGDLMLCEVLQGLESEQATRVEALLRRFE